MALAVLAAGAAAFLARGVLLPSIGSWLLRADPLVRADAIIVLAGGTPYREIEAADLYRAGYAPRVVLTVERDSLGADVLRARGIAFETPLELKRRILRSLGVPDSAITFLDEVRATSTRNEGEIVGPWISAHDARRVIVVTSPYHTARASLVLRRALRDDRVEVIAHPVSFEPFSPDSWWRDRDQLKKGVVELQKLIFYYVAYR
jgi:uncharacterized SAM-binding protein YcdF (DUF218 family)